MTNKDEQTFDQLEPTVESLQGRKGDFLEESEVPAEHVPAEYADIAPALAKHIEDLEQEVEQLHAAKEFEDEVFNNMGQLIQDVKGENVILRSAYEVVALALIRRTLYVIGLTVANAILIAVVLVMLFN